MCMYMNINVTFIDHNKIFKLLLLCEQQTIHFKIPLEKKLLK